MKIRPLTAIMITAVVAPLLALGASAPTSAAGVHDAHRAGDSPQHPSARRADDARGDVLRVTQAGGEDVFTPAPARRHGDITAFRVAHRDAAVVGTVEVRKLTRNDRFFGAVLQLRTVQATYSAVVYRSRPGHRLETRFDGGGRHSCARLRHHLDHGADTVRISVPRTCLGNPAWVRSRAVIDYFDRSGTGDAFFADAAPGAGLTRVPFLARTWHRSR